jgi:hypothetical protein
MGGEGQTGGLSPQSHPTQTFHRKTRKDRKASQDLQNGLRTRVGKWCPRNSGRGLSQRRKQPPCKVEVESTDYAQREYGVTPEQVAALEKTTDRRYRTLKRSGNLVTVTAEQLRKR